MTWVLYNDDEIILATDEALVTHSLDAGYVLHGQSEDDHTISRFVDEINAMVLRNPNNKGG